jgi:hypothetical protein
LANLRANATAGKGAARASAIYVTEPHIALVDKRLVL